MSDVSHLRNLKTVFQKDLNEAFELKNKGETVIWLHFDHCLDIDVYIKRKHESLEKINDLILIAEGK